jgi:putative transposase
MRRVEQQVIAPSHPQFRAIDALAFASKNLWNLANYHVRQSFLKQQQYLNNTAAFHLLKETEAYQALPAKVANQVLLQLHQAWTAFLLPWRSTGSARPSSRDDPGSPSICTKRRGATSWCLNLVVSGRPNCAKERSL